MHRLTAAIRADLYSLRSRGWLWILWGAVPSTGIAVFVAHSTAHYARSRISPTGYVDPRYMIEGIGAIPLWTACVGLALLAFDLSRTDRRDGAFQSVFVRPVANVELVLGRLCALVVAAWVPLVIFAIAIPGIGIASQLLDWPISGTVRSGLLVRFLLFESMPAIIIFAGFALLMTATGSRILAVVPLVALGTQIYILFHVPSYLRESVSVIGTLGGIASDFMPVVAKGNEVFRAGCSTLIGTGLCVITAAMHPRLDTVRPISSLAAGLAFVLPGVMGLAYLVRADFHEIAERDAWAEAHASVSGHHGADVERISAKVGIDPEEGLSVEAILNLALPRRTISHLVLSSNPGIRIVEVRLDDRTVDFSHDSGLLTVMLEKTTAKYVTLFVKSNGVPDPHFAYLDSAVDAHAASLADSQLQLLGTEASIFSKHYVALMPGVRWMPFPGANYQSNAAESPIRDSFELNLEVTVPSDWVAVGPGPPVDIDRQGPTHTYRFRPATALSDFGVLASPLLDRNAIVVNGTKFELFMHPEHQRNLDYIGPGVVEHYVGTLRPDALSSNADLFFPYGGLSIVEVPSTLRGYGGGWRLDSVLGLPGVILVREHGFPTAWLASPWGDDAISRTLYLGNYLDRDYSGGNLVSAVSRHPLPFQDSPRRRAVHCAGHSA